MIEDSLGPVDADRLPLVGYVPEIMQAPILPNANENANENAKKEHLDPVEEPANPAIINQNEPLPNLDEIDGSEDDDPDMSSSFCDVQ